MKLRRTDKMPGRSGSYNYGRATIWVSGDDSTGVWATARLHPGDEGVTFSERSIAEGLASATAYIDEERRRARLTSHARTR